MGSLQNRDTSISVSYTHLDVYKRQDIARINFYRFCQLLEQSQQKAPLGSTDNSAADAVRFRPHPGMGFPVSELKHVERDVDNPDAVSYTHLWRTQKEISIDL